MRDRNNDPQRRFCSALLAMALFGLFLSNFFYHIEGIHGFSCCSSVSAPARQHRSRHHLPSLQRSTSSPAIGQRRQQHQQPNERIAASFISLQSSALTDGASSTAGADKQSSSYDYTVIDASAATSDWEIDCYSRPVLVAGSGKKLWEVLITDSAGSFRFRKELPSNLVNSKTLRSVVDELIDIVEIKPSTIRFFRGAMFNMIQIALSELPVTSKPSRCTFALASWLEELHKDVYPTMDGYNVNMISSSSTPSFLDVRTPIKLPDSLRGEKYAFVALPVQEFLPGGGVTSESIGVGRLCQLPNNGLDLPADEFVPGLVVLSARAPALAAWLSGTEIVAIQADLRKRVLTMETDIDTQYLMAKLNDQQRSEAASFEEGKDRLNGLHFVSVQKTEDDDPEGFWLLRELPNGI